MEIIKQEKLQDHIKEFCDLVERMNNGKVSEVIDQTTGDGYSVFPPLHETDEELLEKYPNTLVNKVETNIRDKLYSEGEFSVRTIPLDFFHYEIIVDEIEPFWEYEAEIITDEPTDESFIERLDRYHATLTTGESVGFGQCLSLIKKFT